MSTRSTGALAPPVRVRLTDAALLHLGPGRRLAEDDVDAGRPQRLAGPRRAHLREIVQQARSGMDDGDHVAAAAERVGGVDRRRRSADHADAGARRRSPRARPRGRPAVRRRWTLAAAGNFGSGIVSAPRACTSAVYSSAPSARCSRRAPASMRMAPRRGPHLDPVAGGQRDGPAAGERGGRRRLARDRIGHRGHGAARLAPGIDEDDAGVVVGLTGRGRGADPAAVPAEHHDGPLRHQVLRRMATTAGCGGAPTLRWGQLLPRGAAAASVRVPKRSPGCWTDRNSACSPGPNAGPGRLRLARHRGEQAGRPRAPRPSPGPGRRRRS